MGTVSDRFATHSQPDAVLGLHHIRIPVSDAWVSRDWYMLVLRLKPLLHLEEEDGVVGVVLRHPRGFVIGLHRDPPRALALRGFAVLGLTIASRPELTRWAGVLDELDVAHHPIEEGHLGWYFDVPDPDGILVRFHTGTGPDAEDA
jgi:hypothetical protein